jgi:dATP/dGTP diphosphohydrolase/uncharacterized protein DUF4406
VSDHSHLHLEDYQYKSVRPVDLGPHPAVRWQDTDPPRHPVAFISGAMRGIPQFNFPAFDAAAEDLRSRGIGVISPAEHDRAGGFDETKDTLEGFDLEAAMAWDLEQVRECDWLVLLPGWENSVGARGELAVALAHLKPVHLYHGPGKELTVLGQLASTPASSGEVRVTDPVTGGQKGSKLAQLGALDPDALMEVAKVAGFGSAKYDRYNFLRGYRWSLSYDAHQRHVHAFWSGEDIDPESNLYHLAHACWHDLALLAFMLHDLGTDDRPWHPRHDAGMGAL